MTPGAVSFRAHAVASAQPFHVAHWGPTEVALVLAAEVQGVVVPHSGAGHCGLEVLAEHQPAGLLEPQLLLELERAHRRHGLEVGVEP